MNRLLMTIIITTMSSALLESILPEGRIKKPALGVIALVAFAIVLAPFGDILQKAKENRMFKEGDIFIEKNHK